jgi:hypothetical protein
MQTAFSQLPFNVKIPDKKERLEKQKEKSPAAEQIKLMEDKQKDLNTHMGNPRWQTGGEYSFGKKEYEETQLRIKELETIMARIKEKDPKLAEKLDYNVSIEGFKSKYDNNLTKFNEWSLKKEANTYIEDKGRYARTMKDKYNSMFTYKFFSEYMFEKLNYAEAKTKMVEIVTKYPDIKKNAYYYNPLVDFYEKDFPVFAEKDLPAAIDKLKKTATEEFEKRTSSSIASIEEAISFCRTMMELTPQFTFYPQKLSELEDIKAKFYKYLDEKVYVSDVHKKNVGKVLLSNKPIIPGKEKEGDFKTEFTENEVIYGIVYYNGLVEATCDYAMYIEGNLYIKEGRLAEGAAFADNRPKATTFTFAVIPDVAAEKMKTKRGANDFEAFRMTESIYGKIKNIGEFADKKIKIELVINRKTIPFTIDASTSYSNLQKTFDAIKQQRANDLRFPKSKVHNAEIAAAFSSAIVNEVGGTVQKVVVFDPAWTYVKNKYTGIITSREGVAYAMVKDKDGKCYLYGGVVEQEKAGTGYGKPRLDKFFEDYTNDDGNYYTEDMDGKELSGSGRVGFEINCSNVSK